MLSIPLQNTGKLLALCLVLVFALYHGLYLARNGVTPCKGLFKHGMVKGDGETWQPWGCMMHTYTKTYLHSSRHGIHVELCLFLKTRNRELL